MANHNSLWVIIYLFCICVKMYHVFNQFRHFVCIVCSHQVHPHCGMLAPSAFRTFWNLVLTQQPALAPSPHSPAATIYIQDLTRLSSTGQWTRMAFVPQAWFISFSFIVSSVCFQGCTLSCCNVNGTFYSSSEDSWVVSSSGSYRCCCCYNQCCVKYLHAFLLGTHRQERISYDNAMVSVWREWHATVSASCRNFSFCIWIPASPYSPSLLAGQEMSSLLSNCNDTEVLLCHLFSAHALYWPLPLPGHTLRASVLDSP